MKLRKRIVAFAAAAGLAGSLFVISAPVAQAQDVLVSCNKIHGTGTLKPPLSSSLQEIATGFKSTKEYTAPCTGPLTAQVGNMAAFKGKAVGTFDCSFSNAPGVYPPSGKGTVTWTVIDPLKGKPYKTSTYQRLGGSVEGESFNGIAWVPFSNPLSTPPGASTLPDSVSMLGIATKGPGFGADVNGALLQQPSVKKPPEGSDHSFINPLTQEIVPGVDALGIGAACSLPPQTGTIDFVLFASNGLSIGTFLAGMPTRIAGDAGGLTLSFPSDD